MNKDKQKTPDEEKGFFKKRCLSEEATVTE